MPSGVRTHMERDIAASYLEAALLLSSDDDDTDDEELVDQLLFAGMEPMVKRRRQVIGKERLSIERLRREAANTRNELPIEGDDEACSVQTKFRFRLNDLQRVVAALEVPVSVHNTHARSGQPRFR